MFPEPIAASAESTTSRATASPREDAFFSDSLTDGTSTPPAFSGSIFPRVPTGADHDAPLASSVGTSSVSVSSAVSTTNASSLVPPDASRHVLTVPGANAGSRTGTDNRSNSAVFFEPNVGQSDPAVRFLGHGLGYGLYFTSQEAVISLGGASTAAEPAIVRMHFDGANAAPGMLGSSQQPGTLNYFLGHDPAQWHTNIPTYGQVEYHNLYPGTDLVYYGNHGELEYDFVVMPGGDPSAIRLGFERTDHLQVDSSGALVVSVGGLSIRMHRPDLYQQIGGTQRPISGEFRLTGLNQVGFVVDSYDASHALIIDPRLTFSTYLGGSRSDEGHAVAVDANGDVFVAGLTTSPDFPAGGHLGNGGNGDVFVTKFSRDGSNLLYSTVLGGSQVDEGLGLALDSAGDAYVTGFTRSPDFPLVNPLQNFMPVQNAFVSEFGPNGNALVFSTYLGGFGPIGDSGTGVAVDSSGDIYVTGSTASQNFPVTPNAFQQRLAGIQDAFVTRYFPNGRGLFYSSYFGAGEGLMGDTANGIAVNAVGGAYIVGSTQSPDFPIRGMPFQPNLQGPQNAFVAHFDTRMSGQNSVVYSTFLGGSAGDSGNAIAVDPVGNAYVTGATQSGDFPLAGNPFQPNLAGTQNAFMSVLNSDGSALLYSTFLGGSSQDVGTGIAVGARGGVFVTGSTISPDFPTLGVPIQPNLGGGLDAFLAEWQVQGGALPLVFSTFLGGSNNDAALAIALSPRAPGSSPGGSPFCGSSGDGEPCDEPVLTGYSESPDFPTQNAEQGSLNGTRNAIVVEVGDCPLPPALDQSGSSRSGDGSQVTLVWGDDTYQFATDYVISYRVQGTSEWTAFTISQPPGLPFSYTLSVPDATASYDFKVQGKNDCCSSDDSNIISL